MEKETSNAQNGEFKNFEELTRRLLMVPKEELDRQRAASRTESRISKEEGKSTKPSG